MLKEKQYCEVGSRVVLILDYLENDIKVGIGSDGYINNFFKAYRQDPQVMPADAVYKMATSLSGDVLKRGDLGRIKVGAKADVITISVDTSTPINEYNVYDQEDGKILTIDVK